MFIVRKDDMQLIGMSHHVDEIEILAVVENICDRCFYASESLITFESQPDSQTSCKHDSNFFCALSLWFDKWIIFCHPFLRRRHGRTPITWYRTRKYASGKYGMVQISVARFSFRNVRNKTNLQKKMLIYLSLSLP